MRASGRLRGHLGCERPDVHAYCAAHNGTLDEWQQSKAFFFEKKKQKTFVRLATQPHAQSLFASFSSEKEDLTSF
jgi:hypothetical protein